MSRREYDIRRYEEKHAESINDEIIIALVKTLDGEVVEPEHEAHPLPIL